MKGEEDTAEIEFDCETVFDIFEEVERIDDSAKDLLEKKKDSVDFL